MSETTGWTKSLQGGGHITIRHTKGEGVIEILDSYNETLFELTSEEALRVSDELAGFAAFAEVSA